ncbi:MAG: 4a-hydroxytetrahydrobiopterin dehydratase [Candidatus Omnitrophica bacterium]|nr:4a-hydroxytetrahydrobiopterin dehydratase [Candidatus Omnitrophota bacterium]
MPGDMHLFNKGDMVNIKQELVSRKCRACEGESAVLSDAERARYLEGLPEWELSDTGASLVREYRMRSFKEVMALVNQVAELAESEGHHPDIHLTNYRHLRIELSTHVIGGLSENDFIMAAKIDGLGD